MAKYVASFVIGGAVGWVSNESYKTFRSRGENKAYDLQKRLVTWSADYTPKLWNSNWDNRHQIYQSGKESKSKTEKLDENNNVVPEEITATRHLFLIRHGKYILEGDDDKKHVLSPLGREQATATGQRLSKLPFSFSKLVVSTMTRAQETANLINNELKLSEHSVISTDLLREGAPFPPEPPLHNWKPDSLQFIQDNSRIEEGFRSFFHRADPSQMMDSFEIYVCHANVIRYLVCRALQLPPEAWLRMSLHHASITWLSIRPSGRVTIRALGDAGFMDTNQLTTS